MYSVGSGIYRPEAGASYSGGHAISCVGWGKSETGEFYWIMKNSWGCGWGDSGYFKQSWKFNEQSSF